MKTRYVYQYMTPREVARLFDISTQSVYGWGDEVPRKREAELRKEINRRRSLTNADAG